MSIDVQQSVVAWKLQEQLIQGVGIIMSLISTALECCNFMYITLLRQT